MDAAEETRSFPILVVYWFLLAVALAFAVMALLEVNRLRTRLPFQLRVLDRTLQLEVREISGRRGKYKALYAVVDLRLERLDTRQVVNTTEERPVSKDEMVMHSFLDRWERGAALTAMERDGKLEIDPPPAWLPALALSIGMCMFGAFAWMVKPFAEGVRERGMGVKFLVLALFPLGAAAWGIGMNVMKDRAEQTLRRVPVEGRGKSTPTGEFMAELAGMGVKAGEDVRKFIDSDSVSYCEYSWEGKTLRSVSLWCQPGDGDPCAGRLNPANPRDVKWGAEQ